MATKRKKCLLPASGQWVGPPVLYLTLISGPKRAIYDGRKRLKEHKERGLRTHVPELVVHSHKDIITQLINAGHYQRAAEHTYTHAQEFTTRSSKLIREIFEIEQQKIAPYMTALYFAERARQGKLKLPPRVAKRAIERAKRLYERTLEGHKPDIHDLEYVLGPFLDEDYYG